MKRAVPMLLLACALWGYSFPVMQLTMDALRGHVARGNAPLQTPGEMGELRELGLRASFLGWRFGLGALVMLLCFRAARDKFSRDEVRGGIQVGVLFSAGMLCQISGLRFILPSVSSLLTGLTVIFTPLAQSMLFKRHVSARAWLGVALALAGMAVLALPNPGAFADFSVVEKPPLPYLGEWLTVAGALCFTAVLLSIDHFGKRTNPVHLTTAMFIVTSLTTVLIGAPLCGEAVYRASVWVPLLHDLKFLLLYGGLLLLSTVLANYFMYRYQPSVSPTVASVIYCSESIFATLWSLAFQTEQLSKETTAGGVLILCALAVTTLGESSPVEAKV